jgi:hypothetical protein
MNSNSLNFQLDAYLGLRRAWGMDDRSGKPSYCANSPIFLAPKHPRSR